MADHRDVGEITADEDEAILGAKEGRKPPLQLPVQLDLTRYDPAGRRRCAVLVDRLLGGGGDRRMPRESKVIVAGIIDELPTVPANHASTHPIAGLEERWLDTKPRCSGETPLQLAVAAKAVHHAAGKTGVLGRPAHLA